MFRTAAWWFAGWLGPDEVHALGFCKAPSGLKAPCVGVWKNVKDPDVVMWWWRYCIYLYLHYSSCTFATFPIRHLASGFCAFFWSQATAGCEDLLVLLASRLRHEPERKAQMLALMTLKYIEHIDSHWTIELYLLVWVVLTGECSAAMHTHTERRSSGSARSSQRTHIAPTLLMLFEARKDLYVWCLHWETILRWFYDILWYFYDILCLLSQWICRWNPVNLLQSVAGS